ncbi:hypothetical protein LGM43_36775, partial [Burkholderia seminalis]|uniref:hypothetical protein n=1 Tax=Burkholderia seminalis TaxID=488731 RepID=UPI001CF30510
SKSTTVVNDSHSATQVGLFLANGTSQYTFPVNAAGAHAQEEQAEADAKPVAAHASEPVSGGAGVAEQQGNASRESEAISNGAHVSTNTPDLTVAESATKPSESLLLRGVKAVDPQPVPAPMSEMAESDQGRTDSMELAQQPGTHVVVQLGHDPVVQKAATDYAEAAGAHQMVVSDPRNLDLDALKQQMSNVTPEDQVHVHLVGHEGAASANDKATIINAVHEAVRTRNPESGVASAHDISCNSGTCAPVVQAQLKENHGLDVPVYGHEGAVAVKSGGKVVTAKEGAVGTLGFESSTSDFSGGVDEKPLSPKVDPNAVQAQEKQSSAKLAEGKHASQHGHAATAPELAGHAQDGGMLKEAQPVNAEAAVHQGEHAPEIPHEPTHDVTSAQAISCGSGACAPTIQKHLQSDNELDVPTSGSGDGSGVDGKGVVVTTSKYDPPGPGRYGELTVVRKEYELDLREGAFLPTNIEDYRMRILKDGTVRWRRLSGAMVDTGNFRFVINESGIYASDIDDELTGYGRFHHGSLVSNSWPTYAGRGYAEEGKIYFLNNNTGHFRQPRSRIGDMFWVFLTNGVDVSYPMDLWYKGRMWLPDPKNPDIPYRDLQTPLKDRSDLSMFKIYNDSDPDRIDKTPGEYRSGVNRMDAPIRNHIDVP